MIIVINVAVRFGLSFKILNLALPIFVPNKSPKVEINPPSNKRKIIKSQPDTLLSLSFHHNKELVIIVQLNLFPKAIGSKTVIFFLSILSNPESFKSPNSLVIVTLVEPMASAIA